jgi:hypothetical protein
VAREHVGLNSTGIFTTRSSGCSDRANGEKRVNANRPQASGRNIVFEESTCLNILFLLY